MAEAIRAYMADPNYIKTVAPKTATRIREYVNSNPKPKDIIQFNTLAAGSAAGAATMLGPDKAEGKPMAEHNPFDAAASESGKPNFFAQFDQFPAEDTGSGPLVVTVAPQRRAQALPELQPAAYSLAVDGVMEPATRLATQTFQRGRGLAADGIVGPLTIRTLQAALAERAEPWTVVRASGVGPAEWMPPARIDRILVHWTAGQHRASGLDRSHYHILIEGDGKLIRGTPSNALNDAGGVRPGYAAHTLNCNSGSIGVSLCCMAGAIESPFNAGAAPMTRIQWEALPDVLADLCRRYGITVGPKTVLSHAEVQGTLGIKQKGEWNISWLAFDAGVSGAKTCGDRLRAATQAKL